MLGEKVGEVGEDVEDDVWSLVISWCLRHLGQRLGTRPCRLTSVDLYQHLGRSLSIDEINRWMELLRAASERSYEDIPQSLCESTNERRLVEGEGAEQYHLSNPPSSTSRICASLTSQCPMPKTILSYKDLRDRG